MADAFNFGAFYSPSLIGFVTSCFLFGTACMQTVHYCKTYPNDKRRLKFLVFLCMLIDVAILIALLHGLFSIYIRGKLPEDQATLFSPPVDMHVVAFLTYITTSLVQLFYAMRVWILSNRNYALIIIIIGLSLLQLASGFAFAIQFLIDPAFVQFQEPKKQISGVIELLATALCDIIISVTLVYYLRSYRSGLSSSDNVVTRIIVFSVGAGVLSCIVVICGLVTWLTMPKSIMFSAFHFTLSKIYVNSLLVTLNNRRKFRRNMGLATRGEGFLYDEDETSSSTHTGDFGAGVVLTELSDGTCVASRTGDSHHPLEFRISGDGARELIELEEVRFHPMEGSIPGSLIKP